MADTNDAPIPLKDRAGPIVAFDFDGTLTVRDSFIGFLRWRCSAPRFAMGLARLAPELARYALQRDRHRLKAAAVTEFLAGLSRDALIAEARAFAAQQAPYLLRPDAIRVWRRHQSDGARVVVVTASPELIVEPFAHGLGADLTIGTRLKFDRQGRVAPGLDGLNCRGPEKVARLRQVFGDDVTLLAAYGDSDGDAEMLAIAESGQMKYFAGAPVTSKF